MTTMLTMTTKPLTLSLSLAALLALALLPGRAHAQLRAADAILDDYAQAVGGKAFDRHKAIYMKREVTVKGMGVQGTEERWAQAPDRFLSVMQLPGVGTVKVGSTGSKRWSQDPINGLRLMTGAEGEQAGIDGTWNADTQLRKLFKTRKAVPPPAGAPKDAKLECVELTPAVAQPTTMCFDAVTHLRVYDEGKRSSPQGELPFSARLSDWRDVGGIKVAHLEQMTVGPMTLESKVVEVKLDPKIPAGQFKMPAPRKP
jgi:hypothetical protein